MSIDQDPDWDNLRRDNNTIYIICPDVYCKGFTEPQMRCENIGYHNVPVCPHKEEASKILHCYHGHPNKLAIDYGSWNRVDCQEKDCYSSSFKLTGGKYRRVLLNTLDDFLLKPFGK